MVPGCRVFSNAIAAGGIVKAMRVPDGQRISNARLKAPKGDIASEDSIVPFHPHTCLQDLMGRMSLLTFLSSVAQVQTTALLMHI